MTSDATHATVAIQDSGRGIAPNVLTRLTAASARGAGESSQNFGLGLWIVSDLLASIGGTLEIRSEVGIGTEVSFHLPLVA